MVLISVKHNFCLSKRVSDKARKTVKKTLFLFTLEGVWVSKILSMQTKKLEGICLNRYFYYRKRLNTMLAAILDHK